MAVTYINIHRHGIAMSGEFGIENIYKNFDAVPASSFSAGLHPWYIQPQNWEEQFAALKKISTAAAMLAVGECGLDKICKTNYELQKEVFVAQVKLANELNKPLIIHCVRAHDDVIKCLEVARNKMDVIFHGYNKSIELAQRISSKGYYLSFGKSLKNQHMQPIFKALPLEKIFLETDDSILPIEDVYSTAAAIRSISIEALSLQLKQNLKTVFKIAV